MKQIYEYSKSNERSQYRLTRNTLWGGATLNKPGCSSNAPSYAVSSCVTGLRTRGPAAWWKSSSPARRAQSASDMATCFLCHSGKNRQNVDLRESGCGHFGSSVPRPAGPTWLGSDLTWLSILPEYLILVSCQGSDLSIFQDYGQRPKVNPGFLSGARCEPQKQICCTVQGPLL